MEYPQIADDREQVIFYVLVALLATCATLAVILEFGFESGIQTGLILGTLSLSVFSYVKQVKSTINQSVEQLPDVTVGEYIIRPLVFDIKFRPPNRHCTLQFKLYEKKEAGLSPVDMKEFLDSHFDTPEKEFQNTEDIAIASRYPSRVDIEREPFFDPEGLRLRTKSFESSQLRRLAEQTMRKISESANEDVDKNERETVVE